MVSNSVAEHTQPMLKEVRDLAAQVRDLAEIVAENHRTLAADIQALKEAGAERDRKLDKLIAQTWVLLALMGVALILELAILGLLLTR